MEQYPAIRWLVRHGRRSSPVVAALPLAVTALGVGLDGWSPFSWVTAVFLAVGLGFAFRALVELIQIIADMLLPQ